jgi:hypothetical protein
LEARWKAENELAKAKAEQALMVLCARDVEQYVKAEQAKTRMLTEKRLVEIEKAHASLRSSGNVPGLGEAGSVETVVSSGSISPNSSVSEAEVRALFKEKEELLLRNGELERALLRLGMDPKEPEMCKNTWTLGSDGVPVEEEIMDNLGIDAYVVDMNSEGKAVARLRASVCQVGA